MKHHYVYRSYEEGGREYIGIRTCNSLPEEDTQYFGSFKDKSFNPTKKTILFTGDTREEVAEIEIELHDFFDVAVNPQCANQAKATSTKFDVTGVILGPRPEKVRKKISKTLSGVPLTKGRKQKISESKFGRYRGAESPFSKAIIAIKPDGTKLHFGSSCEAASELRITPSNLCRYLKFGHLPLWGKFKGWQFLFENP